MNKKNISVQSIESERKKRELNDEWRDDDDEDDDDEVAKDVDIWDETNYLEVLSDYGEEETDETVDGDNRLI